MGFNIGNAWLNLGVTYDPLNHRLYSVFPGTVYDGVCLPTDLTHKTQHSQHSQLQQNTTLFLVSMNMQTQQMKYYAIQGVDPVLSQAYVSDSIEVTSDGRGIWIMVSFDAGPPRRNDKDGKERGTLATYVTQFFKLDLVTYNVTATSVPFYGYSCTGLTHTKTQCLNSFATVSISIYLQRLRF